MANADKVNILLVDDQPPKLLSYEVILGALDEHLIKAASAREALEILLKNDIAVILIDVCMPDLDGFELAAMIREHPRFQKTAIIFISAVQISDVDRLRGYEMGAVDYVPVPVVPEVLRAKVRVFAELYRKNRQLEELNTELERRVAERTAELEMSASQLRESEERRSLALAAGQMGSWDWDLKNGSCVWDEGQRRIFGVDNANFEVGVDNVRPLIEPDDWRHFEKLFSELQTGALPGQIEFRIRRPNGEIRTCLGIAAATFDGSGALVRISGLTMDITERKRAEESQLLLAREVDHRARNALAVVQSIVRLTNAPTRDGYVLAIEGRIKALARAHTLLSEYRWQGADLNRLVSEEIAPYQTDGRSAVRVAGPLVTLAPERAQAMALALHELTTNAAKYGALSKPGGALEVHWKLEPDGLVLEWRERVVGGIQQPTGRGFGTKVINSSVEQQLEGRVTFDWQPEGLYCVLRVPHVGVKRANGKPQVAAHTPQDPAHPLRRILVVEDEVLVAMMMDDLLRDLDFSVAGPSHRLADAHAIVEGEHVDAAILDVNVAGENVYPVAETLMARGIPFAFVTGYDALSVDDRFRNAPVLQKPVDRQKLAHVTTLLFAAAQSRAADPAAIV